MTVGGEPVSSSGSIYRIGEGGGEMTRKGVPWTSDISERHRPLWAVPHATDPRCPCWHRGRATTGQISSDMQHPLDWAAGVLARFQHEMATDRPGPQS